LISVAAFGEIESGVTIERVDERINAHFGVSGKKTLPGRPGQGSGETRFDAAETARTRH
jgi:hypothetical protein